MRLLAIYVLIALAVVVLYAPWGLALRPWDYSLLRAGASIICAIALAGTFGASTYLTLKEPDMKLLEPASILKDDEVLPLLEEYTDEAFVGGIASDAIEQVHSASRKRARLLKVVSQQFSEGSISWDKFAGMVEIAKSTILRNTALVANSIQGFDREGYAKELAQAKRRNKMGDSIPESLAIYEQSLSDMREIIEANDRVLLEMGKLELELTRLGADDTLDCASDTLDELQSLINDTKYYH